MLPATTDTAQAQKQTIQVLPDAKKNAGNLDFFGQTKRGPLLPAFGTRMREHALRTLYRHDYNWMVQGAFAGIMNVIASTPKVIKAPEKITATEEKFWKERSKAAGFVPGKGEPEKRADVEYWENVIFNQIDFGRGWSSFCQKGVDYLRQDGGWFWEIIAPGNPMRPPTGAITGIAHLDSLRCVPTGDPDYPVIYCDRHNKWHLMHNTRVVQLVDMPDGDETRPGYGLSALSRAVSISAREILIGRYVEANLDDLPPPGFVVAKGMTKSERDAALALYRKDRSNDAQQPWGNQLWFFAIDPSLDVGLDAQSFTQAPEKFDFKTYTEIDIDALALAIGVDRQDLWQLSGGNIGSGAQSETLSQKSRGKLIGSMRNEMQTKITEQLPEGYTFEFEYKDAQEDTEKATIAKLWSDVASALEKNLEPDEIRQILADQIEAVKDVIADAKGTVKPVDMDIIRPPDPAPIIAGGAPGKDANPASNGKPAVSGRGGTADSKGTRKSLRDKALVAEPGNARTAAKGISDTRNAFTDDFADLIEARKEGTISALRFGISGRGMLRQYGLQAFRDGLEAGGVNTVDSEDKALELDEDENATLSQWVVEQSRYLTTFAKSITDGLDVDPDTRASLWANKGLSEIYQQGLLSADANGMYMWLIGNTEESCGDCSRLNGQVHRLKEYHKRGWFPQSGQLFCRGYNCRCTMVKTQDKARGRF